MDDSSTDTLRKLAPSWTLAGDEQLFNILQNTHQRLLSKCQEANSQLEQMATALNDASVSLQNVNNQFMALSNSQFIETRVYDDDDVATETPVTKETPKPEVADELTSLKRSISVLENTHEIITILQDSDTESDSDDEMPARMVMKPKDMYSSRPLPYIIGTQAFKNRWHAGLLLEDSDSDSSGSKVEHDSDQYSQSEPEDTHTDKLPVPHTQTTVSGSSSELPSEQGSAPMPTPADVAGEIARRLGAREPPKMVEREPEEEDEPPKPAARKIYRPQDPVSSTIFPDEPPPLSDHSDSQESDIFAELHRSQPFATTNVANDLFGDESDGDIFSDFVNKPSTKPTSLFDAGPAPHMFVKQSDNHHRTADVLNDSRREDGRNTGVDGSRRNTEVDGSRREDRRNIGVDGSRRDDRRNTEVDGSRRNTEVDGSKRNDRRTGVLDVSRREERNVAVDDGGNKTEDGGRRDDARDVKKPIGGISLFGNKGTESIGAAILNRNRRQSSTSGGDDSESDSRSESQTNQQIRKEKDIFDDLFARSESKKATKDRDFNKDLKTEIKKKTEDKKIEKPKVDLFSDNLFDDIDDIFSTDVVKMPAKDSGKKSIFEDDDDLFSEIAEPKPMKIEVASSSYKKGLFDSDDELFSENVPQVKADIPKVTKPVEVNKPKIDETKINEASKLSKEVTKSIFDDDDDELFSDMKTSKPEISQERNIPVSKPDDFGKGDETVSKNIAPAVTPNVYKSSSLFDDDDDESDLFAEPSKSSKVENVETAVKEAKLSSLTDVTIPEEKVDPKPSSSVKTDVSEQIVVKKDEDFDINKDRDTEINVNSLKDNNTSVLPVSENVDSVKQTETNVEPNAAKIFDHIHKNIQNIEESSSETNNDFSDQDFDDLPQKEETNKSININSNVEIETNEIPIEKPNIFDKTTLEEDIDELFATTQKHTDNTEIFKTSEPDFTETLPKDSNKTEKDNKTNEVAAKDRQTDIFSSILTEPPVFEKPKEPKKSKNVNALFDDDSDDESLFFKKNDLIFVENPQEFTPTQDRIFSLFTDEPPDDGFSKMSDEFDDDMFSNLPKLRIPQNEDLPPIPDVFENTHLEDDKIPEIEKAPSDEIFSDLPKDIKPASISNEPSLDIEEDIFSPPTIDNKSLNKQISSPGISDEELFKTTANKSNTTLQNKSSPDLLSDDKNLFTTTKLEKPAETEKSVPESKNLDSGSKSPDDLFKSLENSEIPSSENTLKESKSDEDLFKIPEFKKPEISSDIKPEKSEKKVGKLKVGLNINVNALLPGASPKKVKPNDQTDGQSQSQTADSQKPEPRIPESNPESQNTDSKLLKSVSFDGKPESDVLDNKLSKERAKIQVKRRPSTRRARREAVRKSGIDFGEDSTDNSSSIDDPPKKPIVRKESTTDTKHKTEIQPKLETQQAEKNPIPVEKQPIIEPTVKQDIPEPSVPRDVKSKIVYILNDEDIFNTAPVKTAEILDSKSEIDSNTGVTTLGKVYDEKSSKKDQNSSVFGDDDVEKVKKDQNSSVFGDDDDEMFQTKTVVKKPTIFDSDSEEDLFGTSRKEKRIEKVEVKREIKRDVVKGSLFGDEDDDDDLFGVKTKKVVDPKPQPSRSAPKDTPKPAEPVFEDPLSMFGDDD